MWYTLYTLYISCTKTTPINLLVFTYFMWVYPIDMGYRSPKHLNIKSSILLSWRRMKESLFLGYICRYPMHLMRVTYIASTLESLVYVPQIIPYTSILWSWGTLVYDIQTLDLIFFYLKARWNNHILTKGCYLSR